MADDAALKQGAQAGGSETPQEASASREIARPDPSEPPPHVSGVHYTRVPTNQGGSAVPGLGQGAATPNPLDVLDSNSQNSASRSGTSHAISRSERWSTWWVDSVLVTVGLPLLPLVPIVIHRLDDLPKNLVATAPVFILGLGAATRRRAARGTVIAFGLIAGAAFGFDPEPVAHQRDVVIAVTLSVFGAVLFLLDHWYCRVLKGES